MHPFYCEGSGLTKCPLFGSSGFSGYSIEQKQCSTLGFKKLFQVNLHITFMEKVNFKSMAVVNQYHINICVFKMVIVDYICNNWLFRQLLLYKISPL